MAGNWNTTALVAAAGVPGAAPGAVINRFAYTAYGAVQVLSASWVKAAPAVSWQYLHQGLRFEAATGLTSARNRDYSPALGRFLERDPLGFKAGDNNLYRFVGNAPISRTAPSGLCEIIREPLPWPKPASNWTSEDQAAKDRSIVAYRTDGGLLRHYGIDYSRKDSLFNPPWLNDHYSQGKPGDIRTHITCGDYLSMGRTLWDIRRRPPGTIFLHPPRKTWTQLSPDTHGTDNFPELR